jgi:hypothetical protein
MSNEKDLDAESLKIVGKLGLIKMQDGEVWLPCFRDVENHEFDATTVAAMMYLVYERYTSHVPDNAQIEFTKDVMKYFKNMLEVGSNYLLQVNDK